MVDDSILRISEKKYLQTLKLLVEDVKHLATQLDFVVGIARGGLIPATVIAKKFNKPLLVVYASLYKGRTKDTLRLELPKRIDHIKGKHVLLIDDIVDTGETLDAVQTQIMNFEPERVVVRSLFSKEEKIYSVLNLKTEKWVRFWYE